MESPQRILIEQIKSLEGQGYVGIEIARELYVQGHLLPSARRALRACGYDVINYNLADMEGILVSPVPFIRVAFHEMIMEEEIVYWASTAKVINASGCEETYH